GDSSSADLLRGTNGGDLIFWDLATLSGVPASSVTRFGLPAGSRTEAIEVFELGDGADVLSLVHSSQAYMDIDPRAYEFAITAFGGNGSDVIWSGAGSDLLIGDADNDWIAAGDGDDTLYGGTGRDTLDGGAGDDLIFDMNNAVSVDGGDGSDLISLWFDIDTLAMQPSQ